MWKATGKIALLGFVVCAGPHLAHAGPIATVNGVTFPVGIVPGGNQLQAGIVDENTITAVGQTLMGVGFVTAITDQNNNVVWQDGNNGTRLAFTFNNYLASTVVPPTGVTPGQVNFTGGVLGFYTLPAGTNVSSNGSTAADIAKVQSGTLFLAEKGAVSDATGDTLVSTIPAGSSLSAFQNGSGFGFLDVTGGPAGSYFATRTFANAFDTANGGFSDLRLNSSFSTGASGDWTVSGTANVKANAQVPVPEPVSIALLGSALAGLGLCRLRRRR